MAREYHPLQLARSYSPDMGVIFESISFGSESMQMDPVNCKPHVASREI